MDEDFGRRRGATIEMAIEEMPTDRIIPATPRQWVATDENGREVIKQRMLIKDAEGTINIVTLTAVPTGIPGGRKKLKLIDANYRELEVRKHDHGLFQGEIIDQKTVNTPEGQKTYYLVDFNGTERPIREWICADKMRFLEEQPDPPSSPDDDAPGGAKALGMLAALRSLYPDAITPVGLAGKERDNDVAAWLIEHGHSVPVDLARAVRRGLVALKEEIAQRDRLK
jgi:hypothetical protein